MRPLGIALIMVGMVFLLSGVAAAAWARGQANAMSEEDRAADPVQHDFFVTAQNCSLGGAVIGLIVVAIGFLVALRSGSAVKKDKGKEVKEGA